MSGLSDDSIPIGRHLDITDRDGASTTDRKSHATVDSDRVWLGIYYECCLAYSRVYRRRNELSYRGRCPKCGARVSIRVGPQGIAAKMLVATPV